MADMWLAIVFIKRYSIFMMAGCSDSDCGMFSAIMMMCFYVVERMRNNAFIINVNECVAGNLGRPF